VAVKRCAEHQQRTSSEKLTREKKNQKKKGQADIKRLHHAQRVKQEQIKKKNTTSSSQHTP
jgi:hypothetical protein